MFRAFSFFTITVWLLLCATSTIQSEEPDGKTPNAQPPAATKVPADHAAKMKAGLVLFKQHVGPLLRQHCLKCHGGESTKADFSLANREALLDSGMVDKTATDSHLMSVVNHTAEPHMPLGAKKLSKEALAQVARWIDLGAPYDAPLAETKTPAKSGIPQITATDREFWSFQRLQPVAVPQFKADTWSQSDIDRFILAKLHEQNLEPNPIASRRTLIRRAYFDLIGLPPSVAEVEAFIVDKDPQAYAKLIDRLLDSPHYGERWARHWMDVARFAESHGYEQDYDRANAYHYRDFLIRAFNQDLPYDTFVRWQLAGDEIAPDEPLALMATGFLGAGAFPTQLTEAEFESARYDELDDMTTTTGVAFLGLSVGCARCHDHKFDPISSYDYYRMASCFTKTIRSEIDLVVDPKAGPDAKPVKVQVNSEGWPHLKHHADGRGYPHFYEQTFWLQRGDVHQRRGVAEPGFLRVLMADEYPANHWQSAPPEDWTRTSYRRMGLANWMTDPEQGAGHLAARVMVNRLWQHHFGQGLVATPNDFGVQGESPTHRELLDWLAAQLISSGWSLKALHRQMMNSSVYMQTSDVTPERVKIDPEAKFYWRRVPHRLEAEPIRDSLLAVSGLLDEKLYGPGTLDENMTRRSVYFFIKRSKLIPSMMLFDWPEHLVSIGQRATTTTAPQALWLMNSPLARKSAERFAAQMQQIEQDSDRAAAIELAFQTAFGRNPRSAERQQTEAFLTRQTGVYQQAKNSKPEQAAWTDFCQVLLGMNEFVYVD